MFGKGLRLFRLFGFSVEIDVSWLIIAVLVTWSLAAGYFPTYFEGLSTATYWWMGVIGALGLFTSIVLHELSHSLVARRYGLEMRGIRLFVFGGVAQMDEEPETPQAEFMMAIAGPIASIVIAGVTYVAYRVGVTLDWAVPVRAVLYFLATINTVVVVFNLVPAFPLDGGRILRSILWRFGKDLKWATRIAAYSGFAFSIALMMLGLLSFLAGDLIGGIWLILLGFFLRAAAQGSYQQLLVRRVLGDCPVADVMQREIRTVSPSLTIEQLVNDHIYRHHYKMFPVTDNGHLRGCISTDQVKDVPREDWPERRVADVAEPCSPENTVSPQTDALKVFKRMNTEGRSRLMVVDGDKLQGVVSLRDVSQMISLKLELEE